MSEDEIVKTGGKVEYKDFYITYWMKPIPMRDHDYEFAHDSYDGAEDAHDNRYGSGSSLEDCKRQIDEYWEDEYSARNEENYLKTC